MLLAVKVELLIPAPLFRTRRARDDQEEIMAELTYDDYRSFELMVLAIDLRPYIFA